MLDEGTIDLPDAAWDAVRELGSLTLHRNTPHDDDGAIRDRCQEADVVLTNKVPLRREVIAKAPRLRLISTLATGYNIVDVEAASDHGVTVCNVPGYSTPAMAQHTLALILELTNRVGLHAEAVRGGAWTRSEFYYFLERPVVELAGRTVGLVGFGEIAGAVGRLVSALGASVLAFRRHPGEPPPYGPFAWATSVDQVFEEADVVSLHCPLTPETDRLVDAARLARMKPTACLVNTARGGLVVERDLVAALRARGIAGAALDVVAEEPMRPDSPLLGEVPNLIVTPHNGWATEASRRRLLKQTAENIRQFLRGTPVNVVGCGA